MICPKCSINSLLHNGHPFGPLPVSAQGKAHCTCKGFKAQQNLCTSLGPMHSLTSLVCVRVIWNCIILFCGHDLLTVYVARAPVLELWD